MTNDQDWGQPGQYPQEGSGQPWPQDAPWGPRRYDPAAHRQRLGAQHYEHQGQPGWQPFASQPPYPGHQPPQPPPGWQQHGYGQPPSYGAPGDGVPPWEPRPGLQPSQPPPHKPWPARHKVASVFIGLACVAVIAGTAKAVTAPSKPAADTAAATTAASTAPSATASSAAPSCRAQAQAWSADNGQVISSFATDLGTFGTAAQTFASDMLAGGATADDVSAVQSAASAIQSDAQAVEASPAPSCVPGLRANLTAAARYYSEGAGDATNAMNQYSAGDVNAAASDIEAATTALDSGNTKLAAANTAIQNFTAS
jgi:hypothetical protein